MNPSVAVHDPAGHALLHAVQAVLQRRHGTADLVVRLYEAAPAVAAPQPEKIR